MWKLIKAQLELQLKKQMIALITATVGIGIGVPYARVVWEYIKIIFGIE